MSYSIKIKLIPLVVSLLMNFLFSCTKNECNYVESTDSYDNSNDFKKYPFAGVYRLSTSLSTDHTFKDEKLLESSLYIVSDSTNNEKYITRGSFYFQQYPFWDVPNSINQLDNFYGSWILFTQSYFLHKKFRFEVGIKKENENVTPKTFVQGIDLRINNGNPIIVIRVLRNFRIDSDYGYSYAALTPDSKDYCNYLVYEKVSNNIDDDVRKQIQNHMTEVDK